MYYTKDGKRYEILVRSRDIYNSVVTIHEITSGKVNSKHLIKRRFGGYKSYLQANAYERGILAGADEIKILDFDKKTIDMYAPKAIKEIQNIKNTIYENRERLEGYNEYH